MALAGSALLGAVAGLIWVAVAPTPLLREIAQGEAELVNAESSAFIVADAWFVLITAVGGLITGVLGDRLLVRRAGPAAAAGLVLGAVAAALAALWVGDNIGLGTYHHLLATSPVGSSFHASLALGAKSALGALAVVHVGCHPAGRERSADSEGTDSEGRSRVRHVDR